jgi:hypothetical protein
VRFPRSRYRGTTTTYVVPGFEPPEGWPRGREPAARIRLVPNESLLPGPLGHHLGELVQSLVDEGADYGVSIELDTGDRTQRGEYRSGASPVEGIAILVLGAMAGRAAERIFDRVVEWVLAHRRKDEPMDDPVVVTLYGPDGEPLKSVHVPQGEGEAPPREVDTRR